MELSSITTTDFKTFFRRDFSYLNVYDDETTYNMGDQVYYNGLFYEAKSDGLLDILPTVTTSWGKITDDADNYILDDDITKAFSKAEIVFNQGLFASDSQIEIGYLYLTAHYLVNDIKTSMQGVQSTGEQIVNSRSVGGVSESYTIPQEYMNDPVLSFYTKTGYGMEYLSMIIPMLRGNVGVVAGWTNP